MRNSWVVRPDGEDAGFIDKVAWEQIKTNGDEAIKRWIREQLAGTSVTVVLIGTETSQRHYVQYEIQQSGEKRNGLLGIYIHNIRDQYNYTDPMGADPFSVLGYGNVKTYDWIIDRGYENLGRWAEEAYQQSLIS